MLIDDLLRNWARDYDKNNLADCLEKAVCFQVDNVASYLHQECGFKQEGNRLDKPLEQMVPNVAPLAPIMWFEYGGQSIGRDPFKRYGILATIDYDHNKSFNAEKWLEADLPATTRWILQTGYWIMDSEKLISGRWRYYIAVAEDGQPLDIPYVSWNGNRPLTEQEREAELQAKLQREGGPGIMREILTALLAICFAHCKNTAIAERQPSRQVRRAAERTGIPCFSFHTIDIQPSTRILNTEGQIGKNGLAKALHICRGHFAHYTAEHPLFGKYTGTFYRPMHVRGSAEHGIAAKDYRVHP